MKNRRSLLVKLAAVLVILGCVMVVVSSPAQYIDKVDAATDSKTQSLEAKIEQLKKDQKTYAQQIKDAQANAASYQQQKEYMDKQINAIAEQVEASRALINVYDSAITAKEAEIVSKQEQLDTKFDNFKKRLVSSYTDSTMGYLTMLFSSESISDFLISVERMSTMLDYDKRMMKQINDEKATIYGEKSTLEEIRAAQQVVLTELEASEAEFQKKADEAQKLYDDTVQNAAALDKMLADAKRAEESATRELDAYLKELANKHNATYTGGEFSYPLPSSCQTLTSKHGWRTYWIWGKQVTDYHRGIDIACPTGTPVTACADGRVEISGWNNSYGYYVVISHGSGYTTLYAHNSQLLVKQGQQVKRGQQISKSGSTGNSSGPHLHLEISKNGTLLDPLTNGLLSHPWK